MPDVDSQNQNGLRGGWRLIVRDASGIDTYRTSDGGLRKLGAPRITWCGLAPVKANR